MTRREIKEKFLPAWEVMVKMDDGFLASLPAEVKEPLRKTMLSYQSDDDQDDANKYFDLMFYPERGRDD